MKLSIIPKTTYFVDDDVLPSKFLQMRFLSKHHFVTGNANIKLLVNKPIVDKVLSFIFGTLKHQNIDLGCPFGKLSLPVIERGLGHNDQVWPSNVKDVSQVAKK